MIELTSISPTAKQDVTKPMHDMIPLEVCVVVEGPYTGNVVMRTASGSKFEVLDLSVLKYDGCWEGHPAITVRKLRDGEEYTLRLF